MFAYIYKTSCCILLHQLSHIIIYKAVVAHLLHQQPHRKFIEREAIRNGYEREKSNNNILEESLFCVGFYTSGTQLNVVHCRALRSSLDATTIAGCDQQGGGGADSTGMTPFPVSPNNNSSIGSASVRSLAAKLASGPSKKGPGHV